MSLHIYYFQDNNSADVIDGTSFNKTAEKVVPVTPIQHSKVNIGGGANEVTHTYTTIANQPNLTTWPAGDYISRINCDVIGADVSFTIILTRVNSAGTLVETLGTSSPFTTIGFKTFTVNIPSDKPVSAGDRLQVRINAVRAASHGNQELSFTIGTAGSVSQLETPIESSRRRINIT